VSDENEGGRISRRVVHQGRVVTVSVDTVRFPDGSTGTLDLVHHPGAAAVLPVAGSLQDEDPEVLLLRQYRYAAGGYLHEVPAGTRSGPDEAWEDCARRELEEETGQKAGKLLPLTRIFTAPGFTDEVIRLYVAAELSTGERKLDEDEFMDVVRVPFSRALEMVRTGEIVDGKSAVTILYSARFLLGTNGRA
jgi:ADP-ribose pyrophosphatase